MLRMCKRLIAVFVSIAMLFTSISLESVAKTIPLESFVSSDAMVTPSTTESQNSEVVVMGELVEKREANIKHYRMSDGSITAAVYPQEVHYQDENGQFVDINNSLVDDTDGTDKVLATQENEFQVKYMKKSNKNKLYTLNKGKEKITVSIQGVSKVKAKKKEPIELLTEDERNYKLSNIGSAVLYEDIFENVDIEYAVVSKRVKENIILKKAVDFNSIVYSYKIGNHLKVVVEDDKNIAIVDKENKKLVMQISAPIMWDDAGNYYDNLKFEVVEEKNNQVKIRLEWDIEDDMVYPVTIDPVLSFSTNRLEIQDTYIIKSTATTNYNYNDHIKLRNDGYALLEFPTPDLSSGDKIVHAELILAPYMFLDDATSEYSNVNSYNPPLHITTHKILRVWDEKTVTYQNANADSGFFDSTVYSYRILDNDNDFYTWDITRLANEWTEGGVTNNGVLLKFDKAPANGSIANAFFCSTNGKYNPVEYYPQILYQYINTTGIEDYFSYHSQDLGYAGIAYTNDLTGNLTIINPVVQTGGSLMPINVSLVYNTNNVSENKKTIYGNGWNINWSQKIDRTIEDGFGYHIAKFIDGDGTEHYFNYDTTTGVFTDEIDPKRTIIWLDANSYVMKDASRNWMLFKRQGTTKEWYLTRVTDCYGNKIEIELDATNYNKVMKLTSSTGSVVDFLYDANGILSQIKYYDGATHKSVTLGFDNHITANNNCLQSITYADNTVVEYSYHDTESYLTKATDIDGMSVEYGYAWNDIVRVNSITQRSSEHEYGQSVNIAYQTASTTFTDLTNNRNYLYTFAANGTLKSVVDVTDNDGNGYGQYYEFNNGNTSETKNKDKLTFISKTQKNTVNLLRLHSFEENMWSWGYQAWGPETTGTSSAVTIAGTSYFGSKSYRLYRSEDCNASRVLAYTRLNVTGGKKYTLSCYVNTKDMISQGKGASIYVFGDGFEYESDIITETSNRWQRTSVTFNAPESGPITICLCMTASRGYTYFDCIQLEEGELSEYNLLTNAGFEGSFDTTAESWESYTGTGELSTTVCQSGNNALKFTGSLTTDSQHEQVIHTAGNKDDTYIASAFAKADSVPDGGWHFAIVVRFFNNGTHVNTVTIPFNCYANDWQKVSGVAKAEGAYTYIRFFLMYFKNSNSVYFDNAQLIKDNFGSSYTYDDKGNLISTVDLQGKEEYTFTYNENNRLIQQTNLSDGKIKYTYVDGKPTELSSVSSGGVSVLYDYDDKGNTISATTVGSELIDGKYYYIKSMVFSQFLAPQNRSTANGTLIKYAVFDQSSYQRWKLIKNDDGTYGLSPECAPGMLLSAEANTLYDCAKVGLYTKGTAPHQKLNITKLQDDTYRIDFATAPGYSLDGTENGCYAYYTHSGIYQQYTFTLVEDTPIKGSPTMTSSATYSPNGEYMKTITDSRGNTTQYEYNETRGYVDYVTAPDGSITDYTYNESELLTNVSVSKDDDISATAYSYDVAKRLSTIISPSGTRYGFAYDAFSRNNNIKIGDNRNLSSYIYNNKGVLDKLIYGNGTTVEYVYDNLNRQTQTSINDVLKYQYTYDGSSRLLEVDDVINNKEIKYYYDILDRIAIERIIDTVTKSKLAEFEIQYDDTKNRVSGYDVSIGNTEKSTDFIYGELLKAPDIITGVKQNGTRILSYGYDALNRLQTRTLGTTTPFVTEYEYLEGETSGTTTTFVDTVKNGNDILTYTYDNMGNITSVSKNGTIVESYTYDYLGQLETVTRGSDTYEYLYDNGGNILSVKQNGETIKTYSYGDSEWKDLLTAYNGETITYDAIGNPLTYRAGMNFTWTDGRKLSGITKGTDSISYTYDANGLRNSKTVNGTTTEYYWLNGMLQGQQTGNEYILFLYDESGSAYGFILQNDTEQSYYYYEFNLQGDIIGIIDSTGNKVVEYTYNEWGQILNITGTHADTIGQKNPLRYRGYYYDAETGFYYVSSRYYDPEIGRFLNADGYVSTGQGVLGSNMFAYCTNNPINNCDPAGNFKITALFNAVKKALKVSIKMLEQAIIGGGKKQTYNPKSDVSKTLSKSKIMQSEVLDNLDKYIESGKTTTNFEGSVSLYGKDNLYDLDLSYSVGKASYSMTVMEETKTSGLWIFKKTKSRYVINVTVNDIYDFDEYRTDKSLGSILNNWGYDMQQLGVIKPYAWEATYTVYEKWR